MYGEYLAIDAKLRHGVHNAQESGNRLCLLTNLGLVHFELEPVVLEIFLDLLSIDIEDIEVCHGQDTAPTLVAVGQLGVLWIENAVKEGEVVRDLLVAINMEAVLCLGHGGSEIRHVE